MAENKAKIDDTPKGPSGPGEGPRGGYAKPKNTGKTVARLLTYLTRNKLMLVVAFVCVFVSAGCNILGTYLLRPVINDLEAAVFAGQHTLPSLLTTVLLMLATYVVAAAATYGQAAIMAQLAQRGCNRLRKDLFDKLQDLPLSYFDAHTHGELMSRFTNDADNVQMAL